MPSSYKHSENDFVLMSDSEEQAFRDGIAQLLALMSLKLRTYNNGVTGDAGGGVP